MKNLFSNSLLLCLFILSSLSSFAQNKKEIDAKVSVTYAHYLGKTPPLRDLIPLPNTDAEKRKQIKLNKKAPSNFPGRGKYISSNPKALPLGADKLRQTSFEKNGGSLIVEPTVNVDGITSGMSPNDPTGDIGKDYYLQAINATTLAVFDKEGNLVGNTFTGNTIWASLGFTSAGDPIIIYDQEADRWIFTEFPFSNQLLFAISETSDPLGSWTAYNFGTPNFPDYPKYGLWSNAYSVTTNEQGPSVTPCYFIDRAAILNGDANVMIQRIEVPGIASGPGFQTDAPVDWSGSTPPPAGAAPLVLSMVDDAWGSGLQDQIDVYSFNIDWANASNSSVEVESILTSPFDSNPCSVPGFGFSCIPQLNGDGLDGLQENIMNQAHYRNFGSHESMVMTFVVDVTDGENLSGIRWIEMRRPLGGEWSIYQEGTFAPDDGIDRFMPSICMDGNGNIGLGYNVSSEDMYVGVRYTGRRSSDPLGQMTVAEYNVVDGSNTINSGSRFGDYSQMTIDPTNDRTFWYTTEYANNGVSTRIVAFELGRDTTDIGPTAVLSPQNADDLTDSESIQIKVKNFGLDTQSVFQVGYIFENGNPVVEDVNYTLYPDSSYTHSFASTVDMSAIQSYHLKVFTALPEDNSVFNDTLQTLIRKLPQYDAGISSISEFPSLTCAESIDYSYVLTNFGTATLTSATITIDWAATPEVIDWTGNLAVGESETINATLNGLVDGTNQLTISTSNPNGMMDQNEVNNSFGSSFNALPSGGSFTLLLNTDNFPQETTWEITDDAEVVIAQGGPYPNLDNQLIEETFCLDPEECYTFAIFDAYGDGICCSFGMGNYQIVDENGNPLLTGSGDFGTEESSNFCATFVCMMDAGIDFIPESAEGAADGAIIITPINGVGPYTYSIDGGMNFQTDNTFDNLSAGSYDIVVLGDFDCSYETTLDLSACAMMASAAVTDDTTAPGGTGSIDITATGGTPPYQYSIGGNFVSSPTFNNLSSDTYTVSVQDALGCTVEFEVIVDEVVSSNEVIFGQSFELLPNPTKGLFRINASGIQHNSSILFFEILDNTGKIVQKGSLSKYDQTFTGQVSLFYYPDGVYFIRFLDINVHQMLRVVKQK